MGFSFFQVHKTSLDSTLRHPHVRTYASEGEHCKYCEYHYHLDLHWQQTRHSKLYLHLSLDHHCRQPKIRSNTIIILTSTGNKHATVNYTSTLASTTTAVSHRYARCCLLKRTMRRTRTSRAPAGNQNGPQHTQHSMHCIPAGKQAAPIAYRSVNMPARSVTEPPHPAPRVRSHHTIIIPFVSPGTTRKH